MESISSCPSRFSVRDVASSPVLLLFACTCLIVTSLVTLLHRRHRRTSAHAIVRDLFIYPIKGCAGIRVASAAVTPRGLAHDRMLMIIRESDGAFQTQRQLPRMATIRPFWNEKGNLVLTAPESPDFILPLADEEKNKCRRNARVWGHVVPDAIDCGDAVAHWLCETLSIPSLRLVRMPHDHRRPVSNKNSDTQIVSFADGYPLLLASEKSREAVRKLVGVPTLTMQRFRPNVVVDGSGLSAFEEHEWRQVALGEALFSAPEKCKRCQVPRIDPATGTPNSLLANQPTAALKTLTNNYFGVNLIPSTPNTKGNSVVRIGDRIRLVSKAA